MKNFKKVLGVFVFIMVAVLILPKTVFAETDVLDKVLTNGKLVVNSIEPKDINQAWSLIVEDNNLDVVDGIWIDYNGSFNSDFTKCTIYYGQREDKSKSKEVEIVYNYDKDIKAVVDAMVSKLPEDKTKFELTDLEYINYLLYNSENEDHFNLGDFSGQLKKAINYKNFNFVIDNRAGSGSSFSISQMGIAKIQYNNTTYYIEPMLGVSAKNIFYVNDNVQDVKKAIEDRITKVFGKVKIEAFDSEQTVGEFYDIEKEYYASEYEHAKEVISNYLTAEEYAVARENEGMDRATSIEEYGRFQWISNYSSAEEYVNANMPELSFLNEIRDAEVYALNIGEEGLIVPFAVVKDSSKINDDLNYTTNDAKTNITISTSSSTLPLDTLIKAIKLTSGTEYEKIMKLLEVTNSETYDLSLYSNSIDKYITKLDNGKFEVKIPISESLKDKDLIVYYVDENGEVIEYEVTTKDGYAIFTTDHFSVYTLASKTSDNNPVVPSEPTTNNPQTGDNVGLYIGTLLISIVGLISGTLYLKRKKIARSN